MMESPAGDMFLAQIDSVGSAVTDSAGTFYPHGWTEQQQRNATRGHLDHPRPRTGTTSFNPGFDPEGSVYQVGDYVWMRLRGWHGISGIGGEIYDIICRAGAGSAECCPGYLGDNGDGCCDFLGGGGDCDCCDCCDCGGGGGGIDDGSGCDLNCAADACVVNVGGFWYSVLEQNGNGLPVGGGENATLLKWCRDLNGSDMQVSPGEGWVQEGCWWRWTGEGASGVQGCDPGGTPPPGGGGGTDQSCLDEVMAVCSASYPPGSDAWNNCVNNLYQVRCGGGGPTPASPTGGGWDQNTVANTFNANTLGDAPLGGGTGGLGGVIAVTLSVPQGGTGGTTISNTVTGTASTTDNTGTTVITIALADETAIELVTRIVGHRTGGTAGSAGDSYIALHHSGFKRSGGGAATVIGGASTTVSEKRDNGLVTSSVSGSGNNVVIAVTGDTNNNYSWKAEATYQTV